MKTVLPTWSHCIPTLNRIDVLEQAVRLSLAQTCPPIEIIIVDASDKVDAHRARIEAIFAADPGQTVLHYLSSPVKSGSVQRNIAIGQARGDILFIFDDDTLMFPDCAEAILCGYAADPDHRIAAGMASHTAKMPGAQTLPDGDRKDSGSSGAQHASLREHRLLRWIWDKIFLMNAASHFIAYDDPPRMEPAGPVTVGARQLFRLPVLGGYALTVRAGIARAEPFDPVLLSYSPAEDLDVSYRYTRHGFNVVFDGARVHHFEAASGRIKRQQAITLGLMNVASFVARKSARRSRDIPAYYLRYTRRLLAEFLKDGLSRRFTFPQFLGAISALGPSIAIFRHSHEGFDDWYRAQQMRVLGWSAASAQPASEPNSSPSPHNHKG